MVTRFFKKSKDYIINCEKTKYVSNSDISGVKFYFNSGVIYAVDNDLTRKFFLNWHQYWLISSQNGLFTDQTALACTDKMYDNCIERLPEVYNFQILNYKFPMRAKVVHYFTSQIEIEMNKIVFSVIVPHKNIPKLLQRCLDSIPLRDDLEVIVVDDNSDPAVVNFDYFPGKERKDVSLIFDKSGKGAGHARNIGINQAKGHWLIFADADDYFNYCIRDILDEYRDDESDIVFFSVLVVDSKTYKASLHRPNFIPYEIKKYQEGNKNAELFLRYVHGPCWSKLFKREFVKEHSICFQETKVNNDTRFSYMTGYYARRIKADCRALYCMTYRPGSITYSILTEEKLIEKLKVHLEMNLFFEQNNVKVPSHFLVPQTIVEMKRTRFRFSFIQTLVKILEQGNKNLYNKCLSMIIENKVYPKGEILFLIRAEQIRKIIAIIRVKLAIRTRFNNLMNKIPSL